MTTNQNHSGCPMTRDVRSRGIDNVSQINARQKLLNKLLTELAFHK